MYRERLKYSVTEGIRKSSNYQLQVDVVNYSQSIEISYFYPNYFSTIFYDTVNRGTLYFLQVL